MTWRMPTMCANCPFQTKGEGLRLRRSLRPGRWLEILSSLRDGMDFQCHKTTEHDDEGEWVHGTGKLCAGALNYQERQGVSSQLARIMSRLTTPARERLGVK